eukprot:TRINITY_DN19117_c0_g1_i2.p1 TRINITY_DN19117_c0_g1~~TRINITY_DN19117_c0_g1_i2.p1  ORF type:complete len:176 (-),score=3.65 TRINITY_DN19117_c0_g1_i2:11-538(-)
MQNKKFYPWLVVGLLWVVATLNYLDRQMLSTMKPSMMKYIAELAKAENFGRLMAVFLWIYAFMSPVSGIIADRLNRKWMIVGSLFVWSGVTLAMGYATTFAQLYVLRAIMGVSEAFYMPPMYSALIPCLLYTSDAADDMQCVDLGGRRIIKKKRRMTTVSERQLTGVSEAREDMR